MDKLSSKFAFRKNTVQPQKQERVKKEKKEVAPTADTGKEKKLAAWINGAHLINKSALCKDAGIDRANLDKYLQKGEIPTKHVTKVTELLKSYGYAE